MATGTVVAEGNTIEYAHSSAVVKGDILKIGVVIGVAQGDAAANASAAWLIRGRVSMPKASGGSTAIAAGTKLYWDNTNARVTATSSSNTACGYAAAASVDGDATQEVLLAPVA